MCECGSGSSPRQLVVLDFDETILSVDSMLPISSLLPREMKLDKPTNADAVGWIDYTNSVLQRLRLAGFTADELRNVVRATPAVPGMISFLRYLFALKKPKLDVIIVSDANDLFINDWLVHHKFANCFEGIYTNPAYEVDFGGLFVRPYQDYRHCPFSPPNLCKRLVLEQFLSAQKCLGIQYERVIFVADGTHDFCPILTLHKSDIVCARAGFGLDKIIRQYLQCRVMRPQLMHWNNGYDLLGQIQTVLATRPTPNTTMPECKKSIAKCLEIPSKKAVKATRIIPTVTACKKCLKKPESATCRKSPKPSIMLNCNDTC